MTYTPPTKQSLKIGTIEAKIRIATVLMQSTKNKEHKAIYQNRIVLLIQQLKSL